MTTPASPIKRAQMCFQVSFIPTGSANSGNGPSGALLDQGDEDVKVGRVGDRAGVPGEPVALPVDVEAVALGPHGFELLPRHRLAAVVQALAAQVQFAEGRALA